MSIALTTPAQKPRGFRSRTRLVFGAVPFCCTSTGSRTEFITASSIPCSVQNSGLGGLTLYASEHRQHRCYMCPVHPLCGQSHAMLVVAAASSQACEQYLPSVTVQLQGV